MTLPALAPTLAARTIPKGPVFGWASLRADGAVRTPTVEGLAHTTFTTSGRAAIYQALLQLRLAPGTRVLVPTYHCPTMVAPILLAGHQPVYFGIRPDGLPNLQLIDEAQASQARAMIVPHYFGLPQSLHEVRAWCDARKIALIEDCAHCYFGEAGNLPVGAWGDYCTASISKFFPVPEAGLLGSARHKIAPLNLTRQGFKAELKGWVDVLETASKYQRLPGANALLAAVFKFKRGAQSAVRTAPDPMDAPNEADIKKGCDMARIGSQPLTASMALLHALPHGRVMTVRRRNFELYNELLTGLPGAHALSQLPKTPVAPYVFPIWVADADRVYHALRALGAPVFRWDRIWPGTPNLPGDVGHQWSRHVLQLLCHQDLSAEDIQYTARALRAQLACMPAVARAPSALAQEA